MVTVMATVFLWAAAARVGSVDPRVVHFRPTVATGLGPLLALLVSAGWTLLVFQFGRLPRDPHVNAAPALTALALAPLLIVLAVLAPRGLTMPLQSGSHAAPIPLLATEATSLVLPAGILLLIHLAIEVVTLSGWRPDLTSKARVLSGLGWMAFLAFLITGPNLLSGDALEWAGAVGGRSIPQTWLAAAPRSLEPWWPAIQIILASGLLSVGIGFVRDVMLAVREFRK